MWCCAAARAGSVCGRTPVTMFAYAHAKWCVLRVVSNAYTTDSRQHTRLGRPKRQPANSTAEEEKPPPKSAPARKKAVEVLGCAQHETSVRRTSRKRPRPSRAPQEVTRKTRASLEGLGTSRNGFGLSGASKRAAARFRTFSRSARVVGPPGGGGGGPSRIAEPGLG